jgi:hypothetical protein
MNLSDVVTVLATVGASRRLWSCQFEEGWQDIATPYLRLAHF